VHHLNPTCGDELTLRVKIDDGVVTDVSYDGQGCSISQASASVMSDLVIGKPVEQARAVQSSFLELMHSRGELEPDEDVLQDAVAFRGVSRLSSRVKCALLSWMAWEDATLQAAENAGTTTGGDGDEGHR
jgi:nitrogen fixation NifU-like protein